jgi:hypothetical protein
MNNGDERVAPGHFGGLPGFQPGKTATALGVKLSIVSNRGLIAAAIKRIGVDLIWQPPGNDFR